MNILQKKYSGPKGWEILKSSSLHPSEFELVLVFGSTSMLGEIGLHEQIRSDFPNAQIIASSTSGEIIGTEVNDDSISLTAIRFDKTKIKTAHADIDQLENSFSAGKLLASSFDPKGLKYVFVLSDGQKVNGSELVQGLREHFPEGVVITGGMAGDGSRFHKTLVGLNDLPSEGKIVVTGFYGDINISYGSMGGWTPFGPERIITRSKGNVLYELDNKPALDVYKMYLGDYANELPGSGLLFPMSIKLNTWGSTAVRTLLGINESEKSLTFAGNMPQGVSTRFMQASADKLIEGAFTAAQNSLFLSSQKPELAVLISCVGRKLVLNQRVEEEVEAIRMAYGNNTAITGFYSYGEIAPTLNFAKCELHNQTMTITTFSEL
ncbi:MAG: hypothetical protein K0S32_73 [Bacteroidetes bacterium]|jgi:hypothetical protein|nr:hypothetical protein [Bacteroidota bacterium]